MIPILYEDSMSKFNDLINDILESAQFLIIL